MARRLTSKKDRALLWFVTDGKCPNCGEPLPDEWHADHISPYKVTKQTNVHEMQALCPRCNLEKGDKMLTNHISKEKFRDGQKGAFDTIVARIRAGMFYTTIVLPARYGKSNVIRTTSIYLYREGLISTSLALSPNAILRDQLVDDKKFKECLDLYDINPANLLKRPVTEKDHLYNINANGEMFISLTMQLANQNEATLCLWIRKVIRDTGLPPVVYIDEGHMGGEDLSWGKTVQAFAQAGARIVLLTATPIRSDGRPIPGFIIHPTIIEPVRVYKRRKAYNAEKQEDYQLIDIYEGVKQKISLEAHHETTFRQAWDEAVICKVSRKSFEVDLSKLDSGTYANILLSELSASEARKVLGRVVRDRQVIKSGARSLVEWLNIQRRISPKCAAIVFCGNDKETDQEINQHAKMIRQYINRYDSSLDVIIATSSSGNDDSAATDLIKGFAKYDKGDVLIVKQMASLGLDVPRLKVALDLSPVRSVAAFIQRMMRIATRYGSVAHGIYIAPEECLGLALFEHLVTNEGGEAVITDDLVLIASIEPAPGPEPEPAPNYVVIGTKSGGAGDTNGLTASAPAVELAKDMALELPWILGGTTIPELANVLTNKFEVKTKDTTSDIVDTAELIADLRAEINDRIIEVAKGRMFKTYGKYDQSLFSQLIARAWTELYSHCQMRDMELKAINNLDQLRILKDQAVRMQLNG